MSPTQHRAIWELCRQGLPLVADAAAASWREGRAFKLDSRVVVGREIHSLIEQSNQETRLSHRASGSGQAAVA
ncbi:hypothetical protein HUU62_05390 [Rhodoferax sp. 4810]|uniref:Uncharacterized protein n=2 Tax=Thiospirillum jenense TaxID=1653858 RepID=A0A839H706_9GAMM|nr:hypothetical protein [Rhodoferax jenense]MBB1125201.1 hypothetical protein [Thiospirillum jenense]